MRPIQLNGHIGASVSALVDGQLSSEDEERAWSHVLGCPGCRRLVETEGWTKTQLRAFAPAERATASPALVGALYDVEAWAEVDEIERASRRRFATTAVVGAGSLGVAVLGIVGLTSAPTGAGGPGLPSPASIRTEQVGSMVGAGVGAAYVSARSQQRRSGSSAAAQPVGAPGSSAHHLVAHTAR